MPPALTIAGAEGVVGDSITFVTPEQAKPRDTLIAVVATASTNDGPDYDADELDGWEELAELTGSGQTVWILRREALAEDTGNITIPFLDPLADPAIGTLAVLRNLDTGADVIESGVSVMSATSTFTTPARTLTTYSDLYLGIVLVDNDELDVTVENQTTEIADHAADSMSLCVFTYLHEATGSSGTHVGILASPADGIAASILLKADPIVGFGKSFTFDPIGSIGLPSSGV
jgi:hypothetical protein